MIQAVVILIALCHACSAVYQDTSYPYSTGPLTVSTLTYSPTLMPLNPPAMRTKIYAPVEVDEYATYYYLAGLGGILPAGFYDYLSSFIASHGYVVIAPWPVAGEEGVAFSVESHMENIDWFIENLDADLNGSVASFDHFSMGCHSSGCGINLQVALNRTGFVKSLLNLEPVNWQIRQEQPDFYLPSFNLGSELANGTCSLVGLDFETWYSLLSCPRMLIEVADMGHCDILDDEPFNGCVTTGFCPIGDESQRLTYRDMVGGFVSAFMTGYVQGNVDQLQYMTDIDQIPMDVLQHEIDIECE